MENGTRVWMTPWPEAMDWEFWWFLKEAVSWDLKLGEGSPIGVYGMRGAFVGSVSWLWAGQPTGGWLKDNVGNSQHSKNCVSLSPRVEKLKVKKVRELIFIYCGLFVPILVVYFGLFLLSLRFGQISPVAFFRRFTATSDRNVESCNRIPSNYCLP